MSLLELFILAVGLSMDAFAVSICEGLSAKKLGKKHYLIVGAWFGGFQALMPTIGYLLGSTFEPYITSIDPWVAFVLLAVVFFKRLRHIKRHTLVRGAIMGGLFFLMLSTELTGLKNTPSSTVSLLENTAIILVPMAEAVLRWPSAAWHC